MGEYAPDADPEPGGYERGPIGPTGEIGPTGPTGPTGEIGPTGATPTDGGTLRYPGLIVDSSSSGIVNVWTPISTGTGAMMTGSTTQVRANPPAPLVVHGIAGMEADQEVLFFTGRTAAHPVVFLPESGTLVGADAAYRITTPNNVPIMIRRAEGCLWRRHEDRVRVQLIGDGPNSKVLSRITGVQGQSASTTEISASGVVTFAPLFLQQHGLFHFRAAWEFSHTAAAVPQVDVGLAINGTATYVSLTPVAVAGTYQCMLDALVRVSSAGSSGAWRVNLGWRCPFGATDFDRMGGAQSLPAVDTTVANTLELRIRMNTAQASNSITVMNGFAMQLF